MNIRRINGGRTLTVSLGGRLSRWTTLAILLASTLVAGCDSNSPIGDIAQHPMASQFLLSEEPTDAVKISEAKAALEGEGNVTVIGRINAGDHDPFEPGKAIFVMKSDASTTADPEAAPSNHGGAGHDPDKCPFCKRKNNPLDSGAIVRLNDSETSKPLAIDARDLLGVEKDQIVIVTGTGAVDPLGYLMIDAVGVFVRR